VRRAAFWIVSLIAQVLFSYGLALAGEPVSLWVWRDILGLI
jgi:hypothetical protein